jgi:hypothetical protein
MVMGDHILRVLQTEIDENREEGYGNIKKDQK